MFLIVIFSTKREKKAKQLIKLNLTTDNTTKTGFKRLAMVGTIDAKRLIRNCAANDWHVYLLN